MEESGSEGLDEFILAEVKKGKDSWFDGVDAVCIVCTLHSFFYHPTFLTASPHAFSQITTGLIREHPR
jgi:hypothetical protein